MKRLLMAAIGLSLLTAPAFAGHRGSSHGSNGLAVNAGVLTGKGGLVGTLLGSNGRRGGSQGILVNANVTTGRNGVLGVLLGGGRSSGHHSGHGHGW